MKKTKKIEVISDSKLFCINNFEIYTDNELLKVLLFFEEERGHV